MIQAAVMIIATAGVGAGLAIGLVALKVAIKQTIKTVVRALERSAVTAAERVALKASRRTADDLSSVGRWMGKTEHEAMLATGRVQEGTGGMTFVASPALVESFMAQAASGSRYVEFAVPTSALSAAGRGGWAAIRGPGSMWARHGLAVSEMPIATAISWIASKL